MAVTCDCDDLSTSVYADTTLPFFANHSDLTALLDILRSILKLTQQIESVPDRMLLDIGKLLDERSIMAPHVTSLQLRQELELNNKKMMKKFQEAVALLNEAQAQLEREGERLAKLSADGYKLYWWSRTPGGQRIGSICKKKDAERQCARNLAAMVGARRGCRK